MYRVQMMFGVPRWLDSEESARAYLQRCGYPPSHPVVLDENPPRLRKTGVPGVWADESEV